MCVICVIGTVFDVHSAYIAVRAPGQFIGVILEWAVPFFCFLQELI
jgi:hypothetical protein